MIDKNTLSGKDSDNSSYSNVDHLVRISDIKNFILDDTLLVRDNNRESDFIYFDIENKIIVINIDHSFLCELESSFSSSLIFFFFFEIVCSVTCNSLSEVLCH